MEAGRACDAVLGVELEQPRTDDEGRRCGLGARGRSRPGRVKQPLGGEDVAGERAPDERAEMVLHLDPAQDDALCENRGVPPRDVGKIHSDRRRGRLLRGRTDFD
jgi:hypothetical protein